MIDKLRWLWKILVQTIRGNLPPALDDMPANLRDELAIFLDLSDDDLWAVARGALDARQWKEHQRLLRKNTTEKLTDRERARLEHLRGETDRYVARRSFALALLKWRGHTLSFASNEI